MRCLELFCGTKSVGRAFEALGWTVDSLDIDPSTNPTFCCDIRDFPFERILPGTYQFVHASCPCTHFSRARTTGGPRDLDTANAIVQQTLRCIAHLAPRFWTLENPQSGLLKDQAYMDQHPFVDVSYCKYGFSYRKNTRLWGILPESFEPKFCKKDCEAFDGRRHASTAQRANHPLAVLYQIPAPLCDDIAKSVTQALAP